MKKLLVVCGPTAVGKTSLGIKLAKKFNGEIISADSRQVYKGMDIGTGKEITNLKLQISNCKSQIGYYKIREVKIWLYDVVEPGYQFSVADYVKCADLVIKDIWQRNKLPILVGGTGFYIKAIVKGIETLNIGPDWKLREKLRNYESKQLRNLLKNLAPEKLASMNESDRNNPRRLIRAIEIARQIGNSKLETRNTLKYVDSRVALNPRWFMGKSPILNSKFKTIFLGLTAPRKVLYEMIDKRVEERVRKGVVQEIKRLLKKGYSWADPGFNTLGYKEWQDYFSGKASKEEVVRKWKYDEHAYARRQLTWFKKEKKIIWFDVCKLNFAEVISCISRQLT